MPRSPLRIPGRVLTAVIFLSVLCLLQVLGLAAGDEAPAAPYVLILSVVFVVFLARGHPLARQWARFCAFMLAIGTLGLISFAADVGDGTIWGMAAMFGGIMLAIFWGLSGKGAKRFFDLYCVHCGSFKTRPRSLLFNRVGCKGCGREWRVHTSRVDDTVFE